MPVKAAGCRIEPPVSVPLAPRQSPAATAAAEPPDEPPGTSGVLTPRCLQGEITGPKQDVSFDEPIANSSLFSLPSITAPSRQRLAVTVNSKVGTKFSRIAGAGGGAHVLRRKHVLDAKGKPFQGPRFLASQASVRLSGPGARLVGRFQNVSVEHARLVHGAEVRLDELGRGEFLAPKPVTRLRKCQASELAHSGNTAATIKFPTGRLHKSQHGFIPTPSGRGKNDHQPQAHS